MAVGPGVALAADDGDDDARVDDALALGPGVAEAAAPLGSGDPTDVSPAGRGISIGRAIPIPKPPAATTTRISSPTRTETIGDRRLGREATSSGGGGAVR